MIPPHPWGLFFQSAKFKVQSANVVSLRDKSYDLGPVVKPRDDTREQSSKCKEQSSNVVSRCDGINYLGPVVKPRDDKFLSFLYRSFVL